MIVNVVNVKQAKAAETSVKPKVSRCWQNPLGAQLASERLLRKHHTADGDDDKIKGRSGEAGKEGTEEAGGAGTPPPP